MRRAIYRNKCREGIAHRRHTVPINTTHARSIARKTAKHPCIHPAGAGQWLQLLQLSEKVQVSYSWNRQGTLEQRKAINQSINQSIDQSINQPIDWLIRPLISQERRKKSWKKIWCKLNVVMHDTNEFFRKIETVPACGFDIKLARLRPLLDCSNA